MYAIKNVKSGKFAKHTGETDPTGFYYVEYPWKLVDGIENAQQYTTLIHANEIACWHLDHYDDWVIVDTETNIEYEKKVGKYLPV